MLKRSYWLKRLEHALAEKTVVWLSGVRRAGKTVLCQGIDKVEYFDCELPRVRRLMEDPQTFLWSLKGKTAIFDEVHRLSDPSELLKIAADHYKDVKIIATGSSTLGATAKFKDTLTGRKTDLWLTPLTHEDMVDFGRDDWSRRFLRGGLPGFFLAEKLPEKEYQDWLDAYWSKDIQELFRLERRHSFLKFFELLMVKSGEMFEAASFAKPCDASRTTISNYLSVLETTYIVHVLKPYSTDPDAEITAAPKVFGFDTGFVCYFRGWDKLRDEDRTPLWKHVVLNELQAHLQRRNFQYWRDKQGHEIDFLLTRRGKPPVAIIASWRVEEMDEKSAAVFLNRYPEIPLYSVSFDVDRPFDRKTGDHVIRCVSLSEFLSITQNL